MSQSQLEQDIERIRASRIARARSLGLPPNAPSSPSQVPSPSPGPPLSPDRTLSASPPTQTSPPSRPPIVPPDRIIAAAPLTGSSVDYSRNPIPPDRLTYQTPDLTHSDLDFENLLSASSPSSQEITAAIDAAKLTREGTFEAQLAAEKQKATQLEYQSITLARQGFEEDLASQVESARKQYGIQPSSLQNWIADQRKVFVDFISAKMSDFQAGVSSWESEQRSAFQTSQQGFEKNALQEIEQQISTWRMKERVAHDVALDNLGFLPRLPEGKVPGPESYFFEKGGLQYSPEEIRQIVNVTGVSSEIVAARAAVESQLGGKPVPEETLRFIQAGTLNIDKAILGLQSWILSKAPTPPAEKSSEKPSDQKKKASTEKKKEPNPSTQGPWGLPSGEIPKTETIVLNTERALVGLGVGVVGGLASVVLPWHWVPGISGTLGLITDSEARAKLIGGAMSPVGMGELVGGVLAGLVVGKIAGTTFTKLQGVVKLKQLVAIEETVLPEYLSPEGEIELKPTIEKTAIPSSMADLLQEELQNQPKPSVVLGLGTESGEDIALTRSYGADIIAKLTKGKKVVTTEPIEGSIAEVGGAKIFDVNTGEFLSDRLDLWRELGTQEPKELPPQGWVNPFTLEPAKSLSQAARPIEEILSEPSAMPKIESLLTPEDLRSPWVEALMKPTSVLKPSKSFIEVIGSASLSEESPLGDLGESLGGLGKAPSLSGGEGQGLLSMLKSRIRLGSPMVVEQSQLPRLTSILGSGLAGASVVPSQQGGQYERIGYRASSQEYTIPRGTSSGIVEPSIQFPSLLGLPDIRGSLASLIEGSESRTIQIGGPTLASLVGFGSRTKIQVPSLNPFQFPPSQKDYPVLKPSIKPFQKPKEEQLPSQALKMRTIQQSPSDVDRSGSGDWGLRLFSRSDLIFRMKSKAKGEKDVGLGKWLYSYPVATTRQAVKLAIGEWPYGTSARKTRRPSERKTTRPRRR